MRASLKFLQSNKLSNNAIANILQAILSTILMFVIYRFLNDNLGIALIGIWSIVLASVSSSRLIDVGFSSGVIVFIAKFITKNDYQSVRESIDSLIVILMILLTILLPLLYPLLIFILSLIFVGQDYEIAALILPYSLISVWFIIIASIYQGTIDGFQKMSLRAFLNITSQVFLLILVILMVPKYGIVGLACAQIIQALFLLFCGRLIVMRLVPKLRFYPYFINFSVIKQMINYGANVQLSSFLQLLQEPISKGLVASIGGSVIAGYYEIGYQIVTRLRSLIVTANQAIVPHVASLKQTSYMKLDEIYINNLVVILIVSSIIFTLLHFWSGIFSIILTGNFAYELLFIIKILIISWGINTIATPAYLFNMGDGRVWHNTKTHIIISILNILLGISFGYYFGWKGVALGTSLAVIVGSLYLILTHNIGDMKLSKIPLTNHELLIFTLCAFFYLCGWVYPFNPKEYSFFYTLIMIVAPVFLFFIAIYKHPNIKTLIASKP